MKAPARTPPDCRGTPIEHQILGTIQLLGEGAPSCDSPAHLGCREPARSEQGPGLTQLAARVPVAGEEVGQPRGSPYRSCGDGRAKRPASRGLDLSIRKQRRSRFRSWQTAPYTRPCRATLATPRSWTPTFLWSVALPLHIIPRREGNKACPPFSSGALIRPQAGIFCLRSAPPTMDEPRNRHRRTARPLITARHGRTDCCCALRRFRSNVTRTASRR
jgi:hypothetical protein